MLSILLTALVLACACRERGQGHSWIGTTGNRGLFWALPVGVAVFALSPHGGVFPAALAGALAFVGMASVPHSAGQNLALAWDASGDWEFPRTGKAERCGYLASAWAVRLYLISLPLIPSHPLAVWLPLAGIGAPLAYLAGLHLPQLRWRLTCAPEWGEALTGLFVGAALAAALTI